MKRISTVIAVISMAFAMQVAADETYTCTYGTDQRVVTIKYDVEGQSVPCEVHYTKNTGTERLWRAEGQVGYCESKTAEFLAKQEGWGWSCDKPSGAVAELASEASDSASDVMSAAGDKAADMKEMASDAVDNAGDKAADAVEDVKAAAGDKVEDAKAAAGSMADKATDAADDAKAAVKDMSDKVSQ